MTLYKLKRFAKSKGIKVPKSLDIRRANKNVILTDKNDFFLYLKFWIETCFESYWKSKGHCTVMQAGRDNQCVVIADMITKQNLEYLAERNIKWDTISATNNHKCLIEMRIVHLSRSMKIIVPKKYYTEYKTNYNKLLSH